MQIRYAHEENVEMGRALARMAEILQWLEFRVSNTQVKFNGETRNYILEFEPQEWYPGRIVAIELPETAVRGQHNTGSMSTTNLAFLVNQAYRKGPM